MSNNVMKAKGPILLSIFSSKTIHLFKLITPINLKRCSLWQKNSLHMIAYSIASSSNNWPVMAQMNPTHD